MKILLVDDEEMMIELFSELLSEEGYEVETALNGNQGIEKYKSFAPDLLVLDLMMPDLTGFEVCSYIREQEKDSSTKILLLTGMGGNDIEEKGLKAGANGVLFKPIPIDKLITKISQV